MILSSVLILALTVAPGTFAAGCAQPLVRREWRELTPDEQTNYVNAVICLKMSPSRLPRTLGPVSAVFLPWHRSFLNSYENALRDECGYPGALPFWDWTIDSQAPESSFLWDDWSFGATEILLHLTVVSRMDRMMVSTSRTYDAFRQAVEQGPHNNVHAGIGGTMAIVTMSTNDPIFMLHHANVDRVWSIWQTLNPKLASTYGGRNSNGLVARATDTLPLFGVTTAPTYRVANMFILPLDSRFATLTPTQSKLESLQLALFTRSRMITVPSPTISTRAIQPTNRAPRSLISETNIITPITDEQLVGYHELYSQMIHDYQSRINH
ncbi:hypothetical protein BASA84_001059 [Batrachochytrium salamandrivorans]|nr:hypothetical protein BASA84_001059 [Batrachochytrium salamandrivorans]